jgi:hypothetical protein
MTHNGYHFSTHWRVQGTITEIVEILRDAPDLVRWWPAVYLDVQEVEPGGKNGVGKVVQLFTTGWLPYTLQWQFRMVESNAPHGFTLEAWGDLTGRGVWQLVQDGEWADIYYDWRVQADKPLLRTFSFIMKPLFSANHHWAMAMGEKSLKLELARRQAETQAERDRIPAPPGPTFRWSGDQWKLIIISSIIGLLAGYFMGKRRKG